jgi:hypothetical protein
MGEACSRRRHSRERSGSAGLHRDPEHGTIRRCPADAGDQDGRPGQPRALSAAASAAIGQSRAVLAFEWASGPAWRPGVGRSCLAPCRPRSRPKRSCARPCGRRRHRCDGDRHAVLPGHPAHWHARRERPQQALAARAAAGCPGSAYRGAAGVPMGYAGIRR